MKERHLTLEIMHKIARSGYVVKLRPPEKEAEPMGLVSEPEPKRTGRSPQTKAQWKREMQRK